MQRRQALRALGGSVLGRSVVGGSILGLGSLAGCAARPDDSGSVWSATSGTASETGTQAETPTATRATTEPPTDSPTATSPATRATTPATSSPTRHLTPAGTRSQPTPTGSRFRAVVADVLPDAVPFDHEVRLRPPAETPRVTVSLSNRTDRAHRVRTSTYGLPFPETAGRGPDGRSLVLRERGVEGTEGGCRRALQTSLPMAHRASLAPGESLTGTYRVYNHADNESCWARGTYRFAQRYDATPAGENGSPVSYTWGFALVI